MVNVPTCVQWICTDLNTKKKFGKVCYRKMCAPKYEYSYTCMLSVISCILYKSNVFDKTII